MEILFKNTYWSNIHEMVIILHVLLCPKKWLQGSSMYHAICKATGKSCPELIPPNDARVY